MRPFTPIFITASLAASAAAQEAPTAAELAAFAMEVCVRDTPEVSVNVETGDFVVEGRDGDVARYAHAAGPRLALTVSPGFFACEITVPDADAALHEAMLAEISPAMQARFELIEPEGIETGLVWDATSPEGYSVTVELSLEEDGTLRLTSATQADEAEPSPSQRDN